MERTRNIYKWGAKAFLTSMEVGEVRKDDGSFNWRGMQAVACRLADEFPCQWIFRTKSYGRYVKRVM